MIDSRESDNLTFRKNQPTFPIQPFPIGLDLAAICLLV